MEYEYDFDDYFSDAKDTFDEDEYEDAMDFDGDSWDIEVGYDPYMGCYSDDC